MKRRSLEWSKRKGDIEETRRRRRRRKKRRCERWRKMIRR
jgi:hypothetical protein